MLLEMLKREVLLKIIRLQKYLVALLARVSCSVKSLNQKC